MAAVQGTYNPYRDAKYTLSCRFFIWITTLKGHIYLLVLNLTMCEWSQSTC